MARRGKTQAKRSGSRGTPGWVWLLAGLLLGVIAAIGWYLSQGGKVNDLLPRPNPAAQAPPVSEEPVAQQAPEPRKPKYDFYEVLPAKEVVIPDSELSAAAQAEAIKAQTTPATPNDAVETAGTVRYLIQAGAFRNAAEAEALKARIALTGEVARVETGDSQGTTVYRVRLGPYATAASLAAAKQALASNGIDAQAIKAQ